MIAVARSDGLVCLTDLAEELDVGNTSRLQRPFDDLKAAGLLLPTDLSSVGARRWFRRAPSKVWPWVLELDEQARLAGEAFEGGDQLGASFLDVDQDGSGPP